MAAVSRCSVLTFAFSKHDISKEKTSFGQSDIVRLSDEDAAVELLERAVTGACGTLLTSYPLPPKLSRDHLRLRATQASHTVYDGVKQEVNPFVGHASE